MAGTLKRQFSPREGVGMKNAITATLSLFLFMACFLSNAGVHADDVFRVRLFFGLSKPDGGVVSPGDWKDFESNSISRRFPGYNVVDSTGFYKKKAERSKIVTLIVYEKELEKVKSLAREYAERFEQESVMMVKIKVEEWSFITPDDNAK